MLNCECLVFHYRNGTTSVQRAAQKTLWSVGVNFCMFNHGHLCRANMGPCRRFGSELSVIVECARARHHLWGAGENARLHWIRIFTRRNNLRCWCVHWMDRQRTHILTCKFFMHKIWMSMTTTTTMLHAKEILITPRELRRLNYTSKDTREIASNVFVPWLLPTACTSY